MPSTTTTVSDKSKSSHRVKDGRPSSGLAKKATAAMDALEDEGHSASTNSSASIPLAPGHSNASKPVDVSSSDRLGKERFAKLRARYENPNAILQNDNFDDASPAKDSNAPIAAMDDASIQNMIASERHRHDNEESIRGAYVPQKEGGGDDGDLQFEKRQQQRFAAQEQQRQKSKEQRRRAEDASDRQLGGRMRWGDIEGGDVDDSRNNDIPVELEASVRRNPYAAPRNEDAARERSQGSTGDSSPIPDNRIRQNAPYLYRGSAGTDYPQGNVRYYDVDDDGDYEDEGNGDFEKDGDEDRYLQNRRFWNYEARSPLQPDQQQVNLRQQKAEHPGNLYDGMGVMAAAEGEVDSSQYEDSDEEGGPFSSSAFDSLDYEYLKYVNEREAIRLRLREERELRKLAAVAGIDINNDYEISNARRYRGGDDDFEGEGEYDEEGDLIDRDDIEEEDMTEEEKLADLDARVNYLLYLRSLQANGDPDAENLLREYYHAHYGSDAYDRARERFMSRLSAEEAEEARALKDQILEEEESIDAEEALIDEVLERSGMANPYPALGAYYWSSAAPKRDREEIEYDEDEDADIYDNDYEDDGDYYQQPRAMMAAAVGQGVPAQNTSSIYKTYDGMIPRNQAPPQPQSHSASAANKAVFAAASAEQASRQVGGGRQKGNKKPWVKESNNRVYTVPESVAKYGPSDAEIMLLFFGVLPYSEDIALGAMPRDRKPRAVHRARGFVEAPRSQPIPDESQATFMYSKAPAATTPMIPTGTHLDDMGHPTSVGMFSPDDTDAMAALPFAMDPQNGAMPKDKQFGDGQLILMGQAREEKMKHDVARGYDPKTHHYNGPSRKDYGKKQLPAAASNKPIDQEKISRMEKVFATLFADSDDEDKGTAERGAMVVPAIAALGVGKATVLESKNGKHDDALDEDIKKSDHSSFRTLPIAEESNTKQIGQQNQLKKDDKSNAQSVPMATVVPATFVADGKAKDGSTGYVIPNENVQKGKTLPDDKPAPVLLTSDHSRHDLTTAAAQKSSNGTPLFQAPRVLATNQGIDNHDISSSSRMESGLVAPANSMVSPQVPLAGALDAPRNSSVNHRGGSNYDGAHLTTEDEAKKEAAAANEEKIPVVASSIAPPSYIVGPAIAKTANANAGATVGEKDGSVPVVRDAADDSHIPKTHLSSSAPASDNKPKAAAPPAPAQGLKSSGAPPTSRPAAIIVPHDANAAAIVNPDVVVVPAEVVVNNTNAPAASAGAPITNESANTENGLPPKSKSVAFKAEDVTEKNTWKQNRSCCGPSATKEDIKSAEHQERMRRQGVKADKKHEEKPSDKKDKAIAPVDAKAPAKADEKKNKQ